MGVETLKASVPDWAKDLRLNLSSLVTTGTGLTEQQLWGTLLASAIAARSEQVLAGIDEDATQHLSAPAHQAARSAAAIMSMNNVYYRFLHLVEKPDYAQMPARLRMNVIGNPGVEQLDFELWCLAVSAINGCGRCITSHEAAALGKGATAETVADVVRVAAVVQAVAVTLDAEDHFHAAALTGP